MTPIRTGGSSLAACKALLLLAGAGIVLAGWSGQQMLHEMLIVLLLLVLTAAFVLLLRYEKQMAARHRQLQVQNQRLAQLESHVDQRLVNSAQTLNLTLASVITQAELALQRTGDLEDIKVFSQLIDEAGRMETIASDLIEIKQLEADSMAATEQKRSVGYARAGCE